MARIEQVIHVKYDGEVRECALFDSASDIPSGTPDRLAARKFGLNGAPIYGAVLDDDTSDDGEWVHDNNATELVFHDGDSQSRLLTSPYFIRPKAESLEFGADGGTEYLEDSISVRPTVNGILSTNGTYAGYSCDYDGISVVNIGTRLAPLYVVQCAENTVTEDIAFTLTLTYVFADGSTQDITFKGTQAAAEVKEPWLTVSPTSVTIAAEGGRVSVAVDSSSDLSASSHASWLSVSATRLIVNITVSSNSTTSERTGTVTFTNEDGLTAVLTVTQEGYTDSSTHTLTINLLTDVIASLALTVDGALYGQLYGTVISYGTPYVDEFAHGAVVGWTIAPTNIVGGPTYQSASGEVTMDSDQTVNVKLPQSVDVELHQSAENVQL